MKVEPNDYLKSLTDDVVISCGKESFELYKLKTLLKSLENLFHAKDNTSWYKVERGEYTSFKNIMGQHLSNRQFKIPPDAFDEGIECEILDTNFKEWTKGKFRAKLVLEFIPDEPEPSQYESPLDEIRREIEASKLS